MYSLTLLLGVADKTLQKLYHSTLAIRPKLIELIGKYSQRKGTHWHRYHTRDLLY
jgi:hypothetical protein